MPNTDPIEQINLGSAPDDDTGESLRSAGGKMNTGLAELKEIMDLLGLTETSVDWGDANDNATNLMDILEEINLRLSNTEEDVVSLESAALTLIDDDTFGTATDANVASAESIKAYVDTIAANSAIPADNFVRAGNVFSTDDGEETFTFDTPFSSTDGTTDADIVVLCTRYVANHSSAIGPSTVSLTGFVINRDNAINGVGTTEPFGYIAFNKNALAQTIVRPEDAPLIDDDTFATATDSNVASAESIKAYVDANSSSTPTTPADDNFPVDVTDFEGLTVNGLRKFKQDISATWTGNQISIMPASQYSRILRVEGTFGVNGSAQVPPTYNSAATSALWFSNTLTGLNIGTTGFGSVESYDLTVYYVEPDPLGGGGGAN